MNKIVLQAFKVFFPIHVIVFLFQASIISANDFPEVTLSSGKVQGQKLLSAVNRTYYSFQGIPYAAPPIGIFRFKAPQPLQNWNGTLKAFNISPACAQPWRKVKFPETYSEDCLYINVFTPNLKPSGALLPVMVWIHGGKHYQGSSTRYKYGPDFLNGGDAILVTFNYRLGVFGYLNLNTKSAQGNASLKDMIAALRWIQKEIRHFGGDADRVTIFGGSSGGQDVNCLYISPLTEGLFHRAISHSSQQCGSTYNSYRSFNPSVSIAKAFGCLSSDSENTVNCLRNIPHQALAEKQMDIYIPTPGELPNPFTTTIEEDHGEEMVIPLSPRELLTSYNSAVPYIMGVNSAEGMMYLENPTENPTQFSDFERDFELYLPVEIREHASNETLQYITSLLKTFYFNDNPVASNVQGFVNFMMDTKFMYGIIKTAQNLAPHTPLYLYYFTFKGAFEEPYGSYGADFFNLTGAGHGKELGYLFFRNRLILEHSHLTAHPKECAVLSRMVLLWTNFAKYGNPTPNKTDELLGVSWLPMERTKTNHLIISELLTYEDSSLLRKRVALWDDIYDLVFNQGPDDYDIDYFDRENSFTVGTDVLLAVLILSCIAFVFLIYDCTCRDRRYVRLP